MQQARDEIQSLLGGLPDSRRGFMVGTLAAGFATAVAPTGDLLAQTITTDTDGLVAVRGSNTRGR